ncbi:MAG: c-type cytochrome [Gemmatimonadetes bacterium]|nr:c-type cytochrome [Gemmatimonadota bacterium]
MSVDPNQDRLLDHEYDGIQEYDNPMPRWWLATFWVTIIFSIIYVLNVPGVGIGKGRIADYEADMAKAAELAAKNDPLAGLTDEQLLAAAADPAQRALGSTTFTSMCASCHLADGGGLIGPNLTDAYWINGGKPLEIINTISIGVAAKGMPAWGKILKPDQLKAVTGYVLALKGTTPKTPKAPQGINLDSAAAAVAPADSAAK